MMRYRLLPILALATAILVPACAQAQLADFEANTIGLETAWTAQARVLGYGRGIVSADLWVDETATQKYAVAEMPNGALVRVSASKLDSKNSPIGMEKAKAEVQAIGAKLLGQPTGFEVAEVSIPSIRLVVATASGLVQNFDAETGKLLWATPCGSMDTTALPATLSKAGVLLVQGDNLYQLDWLTGKQLSVKHLPNSTASAVTVIEGKIDAAVGSARQPRLNAMALVGDFSGNLTSYGISEKIAPWSSRTLGRINCRPAISPDRQMIAVSTTAGMVYFFNGSTGPKVQFRYEAKGGLTESLAVGKDAFYVGGNDGSLAKISFSGNIVWMFHLSHPITSPALVDQENGLVFVSSESGELTAVEDATGREAWDYSARANIRGPIALCGPNVICRTSNDRLIAFDKKTGPSSSNEAAKPKFTSNQSLRPEMFVNSMTDRLYLADSNGRIQCLRPIGRELPKVFKPITASESKPADNRPSVQETSPTEAGAMGDDPFGTGMDSTTESVPETDPMGAGDPFGDNP